MLARRIRSRLAEYLSALRISYLRFMGVKIGRRCFVSKDARIDVRRGQVNLGDHVFIAGGSYILSHTGRGEQTTTTLEDNVIVFVNAVICAGVTVGKNAIVGAGAVVTRDVPPNTTVMGNPARVIAPKGNRPRD